MSEQLSPRQEDPKTIMSPERMGAYADQPSENAAVMEHRKLHAETVALSKREAAERNAAIEKLRRRLGGGGEVKSLTEKMGTRKTIILSEAERRGMSTLQEQLRAAEDAKRFKETSDEELGAELEDAFNSAESGELKMDKRIEAPIELDIDDLKKRQADREVDADFEDIQKPPGREAA